MSHSESASSVPPKKLSIIIVNYNGLRFLDECFSSIKEHCAAIDYEVILVDNASADGSADYVEAAHPWVRLVRSPSNLGFTGGNNLGGRHANGELLLLLNNDTRLVQSLAPLIQLFDASDLGVAAPRLVYGDNRLQCSIGYEHSPLRIVLSWIGLSKFDWLPTVFRRLETNPAFYDQPHQQIDWVSGACLATRAALWQQVGGLNEDIFMYCEDVDYCRSVRDLGYRVSYLPSVTVVHYEGGGKAWIGSAAVMRTFRSYLIYVQKHYGAAARVLMTLPLAAVMAFRGVLHGGQAFATTDPARKTIAKEKSAAYFRVARFVATVWDISAQRGRA